MDDKNPKLLDEVVEKILRDAKGMGAGCKEQTAAVESATQLYKLKLEEERLQAEMEEKRIQRETDAEAQKKQIWEQRIGKAIDVGLQVGLTVGGWVAFTMWQSREQRFELHGTPSTPMFRGLLSRMIPSMRK